VGNFRISIALGNWLADTCKHKILGAVVGARFSVRAMRDTCGFADEVLHHDRGFDS
jgi:hypothetical protein